MMHLLDIIIEHRVPDTSRVIPRPVIPDSIPSDTAQAVACTDIPGSSQQLADVTPLPPDLGGLLESNLLWTIVVVLFALYLCFFFIKKYRAKDS